MQKVDPSMMAHSQVYEKCLRALLTMAHPFMPHVTSELWAAVHGSSTMKEEYVSERGCVNSDPTIPLGRKRLAADVAAP